MYHGLATKADCISDVLQEALVSPDKHGISLWAGDWGRTRRMRNYAEWLRLAAQSLAEGALDVAMARIEQAKGEWLKWPCSP